MRESVFAGNGSWQYIFYESEGIESITYVVCICTYILCYVGTSCIQIYETGLSLRHIGNLGIG